MYGDPRTDPAGAPPRPKVRQHHSEVPHAVIQVSSHGAIRHHTAPCPLADANRDCDTEQRLAMVQDLTDVKESQGTERLRSLGGGGGCLGPGLSQEYCPCAHPSWRPCPQEDCHSYRLVVVVLRELSTGPAPDGA